MRRAHARKARPAPVPQEGTVPVRIRVPGTDEFLGRFTYGQRGWWLRPDNGDRNAAFVDMGPYHPGHRELDVVAYLEPDMVYVLGCGRTTRHRIPVDDRLCGVTFGTDGSATFENVDPGGAGDALPVNFP